MKIVKKAEIEIIKRKDLKAGDEILWSNRRCKIKQLPIAHSGSGPIVLFEVVGEKGVIDGNFRTWYKIKSCKEVALCKQCHRTEVAKEGVTCSDCWELNEAASPYDAYGRKDND